MTDVFAMLFALIMLALFAGAVALLWGTTGTGGALAFAGLCALVCRIAGPSHLGRTPRNRRHDPGLSAFQQIAAAGDA